MKKLIQFNMNFFDSLLFLTILLVIASSAVFGLMVFDYSHSEFLAILAGMICFSLQTTIAVAIIPE